MNIYHLLSWESGHCTFLSLVVSSALSAGCVIPPALAVQHRRSSQQRSSTESLWGIWTVIARLGFTFPLRKIGIEWEGTIHLEVRHAWLALKSQWLLADFNGLPHLRHFEKTVLKRQSTFLEKDQSPCFMLSISQDRATFYGLGEETHQKRVCFPPKQASIYSVSGFCYC